MNRTILLACTAALSLSACGLAGQTKTALRVPTPPPERLVCDDEPGRPVGQGAEYVDARGVTRRAVTDEENGTYLRGLRGAGQSCREDVHWLAAWFERLGKKK